MRVHVSGEVPVEIGPDYEGWTLWFQKGMYLMDDGKAYGGYRFIWKDPQGHLLPQRGQARIPTIKQMEYALKMAKERGWQ